MEISSSLSVMISDFLNLLGLSLLVLALFIK